MKQVLAVLSTLTVLGLGYVAADLLAHAAEHPLYVGYLHYGLAACMPAVGFLMGYAHRLVTGAA